MVLQRAADMIFFIEEKAVFERTEIRSVRVVAVIGVQLIALASSTYERGFVLPLGSSKTRKCGREREFERRVGAGIITVLVTEIYSFHHALFPSSAHSRSHPPVFVV